MINPVTMRAMLVNGQCIINRRANKNAPPNLSSARQFMWDCCWNSAKIYLKGNVTSREIGKKFFVSEQRARKMIKTGVQYMLNRGYLIPKSPDADLTVDADRPEADQLADGPVDSPTLVRERETV